MHLLNIFEHCDVLARLSNNLFDDEKDKLIILFKRI